MPSSGTWGKTCLPVRNDPTLPIWNGPANRDIELNGIRVRGPPESPNKAEDLTATRVQHRNQRLPVRVRDSRADG